MTQKLYLADQYLRKFSARVIEEIELDGKPAVILAGTGFYPTSGGQPHDTGVINNIPVLDVIEDEKLGIIHQLAEPLADREIEGEINWERRFDHMQQHTGQHVLSQAFIKTCRAETISFHMGDLSATLDLRQAGLPTEKMFAAEDLANRIVHENRPVISHIIGKNELNQYPVRKPPAVVDDIRIVEIKNFDYSPCGGTHCSKTGEIGVVKITRFENYKGGTRIHFKCGIRALRDYREKSKILKQIGDQLSTGESELYQNIKKMRDELKRLRKEHGNFKKQYLDQEAEAMFSKRQELASLHIISKVFADRNPKDLKILAQKVVENYPKTIVLFGAIAAGKASLLFLRSEDGAIDMAKLMEKACVVIEGRGGGRPQQAQGGGPAVDNLEKALKRALEAISKEANLERRMSIDE